MNIQLIEQKTVDNLSTLEYAYYRFYQLAENYNFSFLFKENEPKFIVTLHIEQYNKMILHQHWLQSLKYLDISVELNLTYFKKEVL